MKSRRMTAAMLAGAVGLVSMTTLTLAEEMNDGTMVSARSSSYSASISVAENRTAGGSASGGQSGSDELPRVRSDSKDAEDTVQRADKIEPNDNIAVFENSTSMQKKDDNITVFENSTSMQKNGEESKSGDGALGEASLAEQPREKSVEQGVGEASLAGDPQEKRVEQGVSTGTQDAQQSREEEQATGRQLPGEFDTDNTTARKQETQEQSVAQTGQAAVNESVQAAQAAEESGPEDAEDIQEPAAFARSMTCVIKTAEGAATVTGLPAPEEAQAVLALLNIHREEAGLPPLEWDECLTATALERAFESAVVWSHVRPDGSEWYTANSRVRGENLARGQQDAQSVAQSWMNSQGHRANIMREGFSKMGVACVQTDSGIYWVQLFAA